MTPSSTFVASSGAGYELQMGRWSRRLAAPFLDFVGCQPDEHILDVGCGTGCLTMALADRCAGGQFTGIDVAAAYIDHAARQTTDPRVEFRVGDGCAIDFADHSFDRVLSLLVLHFIPDPQRAIAQMRRVVRPGGVVGAAVWDARGGFVANRLFFDTAAALDPRADERRARNYTRPLTRPGELGRAWLAAGFDDVVESTLTIRMDFLSFDDYWAPFEGRDGPQADYLATLDAADKSRIRDAVRRAYLDGETDGPRSYLAAAWAVKGVAALPAAARM